VKWLRLLLLELWAMLPIAGVVGFLGPFGTYLSGDLLTRVGRWGMLLLGAYVLARPALLFWRWVARATGLPQTVLVFWGMVAASFPIALIWRSTYGGPEMHLIGGYAGVYSFTLLCSLLVMVVVWWAERADAHLRYYYEDHRPIDPEVVIEIDEGQSATSPVPVPYHSVRPMGPRLQGRLSARFKGDILALESEDHYVRVHGAGQSELLYLRLRDAIAEMDGVAGEQVHRSWWVARHAVMDVAGNGRTREIRVANGQWAPVARDSVERLRQSGFIPE
jgi:hypothetical protein